MKNLTLTILLGIGLLFISRCSIRVVGNAFRTAELCEKAGRGAWVAPKENYRYRCK